MSGKKTDFCVECRKETTYTLKKENIRYTVRGKEYSFCITVAICDECGEEMEIPGILEKNAQEVYDQYRVYEDIVSTEDIKKVMEIYKIGKTPLSLVLGFGEITITRYLTGQIPSKEYSDIIKSALTSPAYMKEKLRENKGKIAVSAYNKATCAATQLESQFSVSDKMLSVIAYLFKKIEEITPLMLQKLLYFTQGISLALYKNPIFSETCQAWVHGPVYPEVYSMFKDFKYNPIEDARFAILRGREKDLTTEERNVVDLISATFGTYSGKILERITHEEEPWKIARDENDFAIPSNEPISLIITKNYFSQKSKEYDFSSTCGISHYIHDIVNKKREV